MALHGNGTALIFARTDTAAMQYYVFPFAESIFFIRGRIKFHYEDGTEGDRANAPSILIGYDEYNADMIEQSGLKGHHVYLKPKIFIAGISYDQNKTWRVVVGEVLEELNREATLEDIYNTITRLAPNKVKNNPHYKAKVRQVCQSHYNRIAPGKYSIN